MAPIEWDNVGERTYQTGIDRGVLYLPDGSGVPWNGLVSLAEASTRETKPFYHDGVKYLESQIPGDFSAELRAFTYPDEFDEMVGIVLSDGILFHDQPAQRFGLSYRTMLGDDAQGTERGYKIHVLWNLLANPSTNTFDTVSEANAPIQFGWSLSGIPEIVAGHRPTCHITIDSTKVPPAVLQVFENRLYGTDEDEPSLVTLTEFLEFEDIVIVDNGDGTWSAWGAPELVVEDEVEEDFEIFEAKATYLDEDTYTIESTDT